MYLPRKQCFPIGKSHANKVMMVNNFQNKCSSLNYKCLKALYRTDKISTHKKCPKSKNFTDTETVAKNTYSNDVDITVPI